MYVVLYKLYIKLITLLNTVHIKLYAREKFKRGLKISISAMINKFKRCAKFYSWSESVERCQPAFC
jgi:hypothetical protein